MVSAKSGRRTGGAPRHFHGLSPMRAGVAALWWQHLKEGRRHSGNGERGGESHARNLPDRCIPRPALTCWTEATGWFRRLSQPVPERTPVLCHCERGREKETATLFFSRDSYHGLARGAEVPGSAAIGK